MCSAVFSMYRFDISSLCLLLNSSCAPTFIDLIFASLFSLYFISKHRKKYTGFDHASLLIEMQVLIIFPSLYRNFPERSNIHWPYIFTYAREAQSLPTCFISILCLTKKIKNKKYSFISCQCISSFFFHSGSTFIDLISFHDTYACQKILI